MPAWNQEKLTVILKTRAAPSAPVSSVESVNLISLKEWLLLLFITKLKQLTCLWQVLSKK